MIKQIVNKDARFRFLKQMAIDQQKCLDGIDLLKSIRRIPNQTYADLERQTIDIIIEEDGQ